MFDVTQQCDIPYPCIAHSHHIVLSDAAAVVASFIAVCCRME